MKNTEEIRKILTEHRYYDRSNDLARSLNASEIDALCSFFESCKTDDDCDEHYLHVVADNVIRKRLRRK